MFWDFNTFSVSFLPSASCVDSKCLEWLTALLKLIVTKIK